MLDGNEVVMTQLTKWMWESQFLAGGEIEVATRDDMTCAVTWTWKSQAQQESGGSTLFAMCESVHVPMLMLMLMLMLIDFFLSSPSVTVWFNSVRWLQHATVYVYSGQTCSSLHFLRCCLTMSYH